MSRKSTVLRQLTHPAFAPALLVLVGCGPSQEVLDRQEAQLQEMIQEAKTDPTNMTPDEREMRRHRLEMDFGEAP